MLEIEKNRCIIIYNTSSIPNSKTFKFSVRSNNNQQIMERSLNSAGNYSLVFNYILHEGMHWCSF